MKWDLIKQIDFNQRPGTRETLVYFLAVLLLLNGFVKSCWTPSNKAIADVVKQIDNMAGQKQELTSLNQKMDNLGIGPKDFRGGDHPSFVGVQGSLQKSLENLTNPLLMKSVKVLSTDYREPKVKSGVREQKIRMQLEGSFAALGAYIEAVESLMPPLVIQELELKHQPAKTGYMQLSLEGSLYEHE